MIDLHMKKHVYSCTHIQRLQLYHNVLMFVVCGAAGATSVQLHRGVNVCTVSHYFTVCFFK